MATSLQQQLAAVAAKRSNQLNLGAQKSAHAKSLIWTPIEAVGQSFEFIYETCCPAFELLITKDAVFLPFKSSVFSRASISQDRNQLTKVENGELDKVLENLLPCLSLYLREREGLHALEWLIRRFKFVAVLLCLRLADFVIAFTNATPKNWSTPSFPYIARPDS
jgi:U3 small nucleolar RNA-associated protein 10